MSATVLTMLKVSGWEEINSLASQNRFFSNGAQLGALDRLEQHIAFRDNSISAVMYALEIYGRALDVLNAENSIWQEIFCQINLWSRWHKLHQKLEDYYRFFEKLGGWCSEDIALHTLLRCGQHESVIKLVPKFWELSRTTSASIHLWYAEALSVGRNQHMANLHYSDAQFYRKANTSTELCFYYYLSLGNHLKRWGDHGKARTAFEFALSTAQLARWKDRIIVAQSALNRVK